MNGASSSSSQSEAIRGPKSIPSGGTAVVKQCFPSSASPAQNPAVQTSQSRNISVGEQIQNQNSMQTSNGLAAAGGKLLTTVREPVLQNHVALAGQVPFLSASPDNVSKPVVGQCEIYGFAKFHDFVLSTSV
jgi:hypothetical protein